MKLKVGILTAAVLCVILCALDGFIYVSLQRHLLNLEASVVINKEQAIVDNIGRVDDFFIWTGDPINVYQRLSSFAQPGQTILLFDPNGHAIAEVGTAPSAATINAFDPNHPMQTHIIRAHDAWHMAVTSPIVTRNNILLGFVFLSSNIQRVQDNLHTLFMALILGSMGAIALSGLGGYAIASEAVRPIDMMIRLVSRIQADHLNERVAIPRGRDEVARLASTFNQMLDRIEHSFEQQARFVTDASHEIRTPLTTIQGYAELLSRWGKEDPQVLDKAIRVIQSETVRLRNLTNDMLTLADLESAQRAFAKTCDAKQAVLEIVEPQILLHKDHTIMVEAPENCVVRMAPEHFKRVMTNLLDNAIKYTPQGGEVRICVEDTDNVATVEITDNGEGIPTEDLPHIFDRFYRVDKARSRKKGGNGLGLAIVKELIELHGGHISVTSEHGTGTTFHFTLPKVSQES